MRREVRAALKHIQIVRKGGKVYRYARPPKGQRVKLPDLPADHPDFIAAYQKALAPAPVASRAPAGTIAAMVDGYQRSAAYGALGAAYRATMARHLGAAVGQAQHFQRAKLHRGSGCSG